MRAAGGEIREVGGRIVQGFAGHGRTSAFNPEGNEKPPEDCEQRSDTLQFTEGPLWFLCEQTGGWQALEAVRQSTRFAWYA